MNRDIKTDIAEAARRLMLEQRINKLTVSAIADECHITRQTFYYHFKGIPELFRWMLEQDSERIMKEALMQIDAREGLRYLFLMGISLLPYIRQGTDTYYKDELIHLLQTYVYRFFANAGDQKEYKPGYSIKERSIVLRYHTHAIIGMLMEWTEDDTAHLDDIVHTVYRIMTENLDKTVS